MKRVSKTLAGLLFLTVVVTAAIYVLNPGDAKNTGYGKQVESNLSRIGDQATKWFHSLEARVQSLFWNVDQNIKSGSQGQGGSGSTGSQPLPLASNIVTEAAPPADQGNGSSQTTGGFGETGIDGLVTYEYGRSTLNKQEQACYDSILNAIRKQQASVQISKCSLELKDIEKIYNYVTNDHTEIFYLNKADVEGTSSLINIAKTYDYTLKFSYKYSAGQIDNMNRTMGESARQILSQVKAKSTDYSKLLTLHDAFIKSTQYDINAVQNPDGYAPSFTAYGALVKHRAVCDGYAHAFKLLLSSAGLKSLYVSGQAASNGSSGSHAWNMVDLNGIWYYTDTTFDDPIVSVNGSYQDYGELTHKTDHEYLYFKSKQDHVLGVYDDGNPWSGTSENYQIMPQIK